MLKKSAGIIPVHKDSRDILLIQQVDGSLATRNSLPTAGHWGFPKGGIEEGENEKQAAIRELREETGLLYPILKDEPIVEKYSFDKDGVHYEKTVVLFVGMVDSKEITIKHDEIQDFVWLPYPEALEKLTFQESKDVLKSVFANFSFGQGAIVAGE